MLKTGNRKAVVSVYALTLSAIGMFLDKVTSDDWVMLVSIVIGAVVTGLTAEHFAKPKLPQAQEQPKEQQP